MEHKDLIQLLVYLEVRLYVLVQDTGRDVLTVSGKKYMGEKHMKSACLR